MAETAIVAIPRENDYVWKISSEKIPHLTLLFLGDQAANPNYTKMVEFAEHVANTSLSPFGLSVDHRGTLGPKKADVLFFEEDRWGFSQIKAARDNLLQNDAISTAYASVTQFDSWIPHLTLGFPETPAKPDKRDFPGTSWVSFDRLAIWTGDFTGAEFRLKDRHDDFEVSMGEVLDSVLTHHGVKGMKWGVHRSRSSSSGGSSKSTDHPDAIKAKLFKAKVKKGSTDSLSTDELQQLVQRMNLEKQFSTLKPPSTGDKTKKILAETLLSVGKQQAGKALNEQASKQITRLLAGASK
jgi:2'-5' RNA ligase